MPFALTNTLAAPWCPLVPMKSWRRAFTA